MKIDIATFEDSLVVTYETKHSDHNHQAVMFLVIYSNKLQAYVHTKICTWTFTEALFTTVKY
jgi:hypothetical protein